MSCGLCDPYFMGDMCTIAVVATSQTTSLSYEAVCATCSTERTVLFVDPDQDVVFAGGAPLVMIVNSSDHVPISPKYFGCDLAVVQHEHHLQVQRS